MTLMAPPASYGGGYGRGKASVEPPAHFRSGQRFKDGLDDSVRLRKHAAIPEAQHAKAARLQERIALIIVACLRHVLAAVQLNDDRCLETDEVADITTDLTLTAEVEAVQLTAAQMLP